MKTKKQFLWLLLALLAAFPTLSAQTKKEKAMLKEQKRELVKKQIVSANYKINVNTALPMQGRSVPLTSNYSLEIRNDSVISYLPYYGRAYSVPHGGGNGLKFMELLKEYSMEMDKKGRARIRFKARNPEDNYVFSLMVYDNGSASLDVTMQNRNSISFIGTLAE